MHFSYYVHMYRNLHLPWNLEFYQIPFQVWKSPGICSKRQISWTETIFFLSPVETSSRDLNLGFVCPSICPSFRQPIQIHCQCDKSSQTALIDSCFRGVLQSKLSDKFDIDFCVTFKNFDRYVCKRWGWGGA